MGDQVVSFGTAKLAKEKGYEQKSTEEGYQLDGMECVDYPLDYMNGKGVAAPTQCSLQRWLRTKNVDITVITDWGKKGRTYDVGFSYVNPSHEVDIWISRKNGISAFHSSYEEALEIGLAKALTFLP